MKKRFLEFLAGFVVLLLFSTLVGMFALKDYIKGPPPVTEGSWPASRPLASLQDNECRHDKTIELFVQKNGLLISCGDKTWIYQGRIEDLAPADNSKASRTQRAAHEDSVE